MKRTIEQWQHCKPEAMAYRQSLPAIQFAFEDAKADILELFALDAYIKAYIGHTVVRDMEFFVQTIAAECARVLEVPVECVGRIRYNGLSMGQNIRVCAGS